MTKRAICLTVPGGKPDPALEQGLSEGGCTVTIAENLGVAMQLLRSTEGQSSATNDAGSILLIILAASVRAGAIPLLTLLHEQGIPMPQTLVYDEDGNDVHTIIKALQLGVREYVLASDPIVQRRLNARLLVERASASPFGEYEVIHTTSSIPLQTEQGRSNVKWDAIGRVIRSGEKYVRLSSVEGRIFDVLLANRTHTISVSELVRVVLMQPDLDASVGARRLRPHVMRLRRKLDRLPTAGMRIVNMRSAGYMLL